MAVIAASSYGLYRELTALIKKSADDAIGILVLKKRTAVRKYADYVIWEDIGNNTPVFNYDSIRTYPESAAYIRLNDGSEINLSENTMIVLATDDFGVRINFDRGTISARSGKSGSSIRLNTRDTSVAMNKGELSVKKDETIMDINIFSGNAVVASGGKENLIDVNSALRIADGKTEIKKVKIKTEEPVNDARFITSSARASIRFVWKSDSGSKHTVEIASDRQFQKIIKKESVHGSTYRAGLQPGDYYWRVGTGRDYSPVKKFTLLKDSSFRYIYPVGDEKVNVTSGDPVSFRWSRSRAEAAYEFEIFSDAELKSSVLKKTLSLNLLSLDNLTSGNFWWRVRRVYPAGFISLDPDEKTMRFMLVQRAFTRMKPVPVYSGRVFATTLSEFIPLNWVEAKGASGYVVEISTDREFNEIINSLNTTAAFIRAPVPPEGEYFWRIKAVYGEKDFETSVVVPLVVGMPEPVEYISPVKNDMLDNTSETIRFVWRDPSGSAGYLLEISTDTEFKKVISSVKTDAREYQLQSPGSGRFYWRVSILDKTGNITVMGFTSGFTIPSELDRPRAISPANLARINLDDVNSLQFRWSAVKGADIYEVEIFRRTSGVDKSLMVLETASTMIELRNFSSLESGTLVWVVRARKKSGKRLAAFSESDRRYFVLKVSENISAPKVQSEDTFYVR